MGYNALSETFGLCFFTMGYTDTQFTFGQSEKMANYLISALYREQGSDFGYSHVSLILL